MSSIVEDIYNAYIELLQKIGFKLVGEFTYDQLEPTIRENCSIDTASITIQLPSPQSGYAVALVFTISYTLNSIREFRVTQCNDSIVVFSETLGGGV